MSNASKAESAARVSSTMPDEAVVRYPVFEIFHSLQGEGYHTGRAAAFVRLGGCDNGCEWCDTKEAQTTAGCRWMTGGEISRLVAEAGARTAVVTGGEPLIWNLDALTEALHAGNIEVFLETSGTHPLSGRFDWICLSPKSFAPPVEANFAAADELKVVAGVSDSDFEYAEECASKTGADCRLFLQPEWNRRREAVPRIVEYIKSHPKWRLSLQTHKFIEIP